MNVMHDCIVSLCLATRFTRGAAIAAPLLFISAVVFAQGGIGGLDGIIDKQRLGDADVDAIHNFAQPLTRDLTGADPAARSAARRNLLAPLNGAVTPSVSFRVEYTEELLTSLQANVRGGNDAAAVSALQLAGALAAPRAESLLRNALLSDSASIRYGAALGYQETLRLMASNQAAVPEGQREEVLRDIGNALANEPNIFVVDALVRALDEARDTAGAMRQLAQGRACEAMIAQIQTRRRAGDGNVVEEASAFLRQVVILRDLLIDLGNVDTNVVALGGTMTGQAMTYCTAVLDQAGGFDGLAPREVATLSALLKASETTATLAATAAGVAGAPQGEPIRRAVDNADLGAVDRGLARWVGPGGALLGAPFSNDAADFN